MKFSVLLPTYWKEKPEYLARALHSVWDDQVLKPDQIVLVEDGPLVEELYSLIEKWKGRLGARLEVVSLPECSGLSKALNVGIQNCAYELIARMDSDDISDPHRFRKQIEVLRQNKDIFVVGGAIQEFSEDGTKLLLIRRYPPDTAAAKKYMAMASPFAHASVVYRKQIFLEGFSYSEGLKTSQDIDLWYRLIGAGFRVANIPDVVYHVRMSDDFCKRRTREKAVAEFKVYWRGVLDLHGRSWRLGYPVLRLLSRLLPSRFVGVIYRTRLRAVLNPKSNALQSSTVCDRALSLKRRFASTFNTKKGERNIEEQGKLFR